MKNIVIDSEQNTITRTIRFSAGTEKHIISVTCVEGKDNKEGGFRIRINGEYKNPYYPADLVAKYIGKKGTIFNPEVKAAFITVRRENTEAVKEIISDLKRMAADCHYADRLSRKHEAAIEKRAQAEMRRAVKETAKRAKEIREKDISFLKSL